MDKIFTIFLFLLFSLNILAGENISRAEFTILKYTELKFLSDSNAVNFSLDPVMIENFKVQSKEEIENIKYDQNIMNEIVTYYISQTDQWQRASDNMRFVLINRVINFAKENPTVKLFELDEKSFQNLVIDLLKKDIRIYAKIKSDALNSNSEAYRKAEPNLNFTMEELDTYFSDLRSKLILSESEVASYIKWIKKYNR